MRDVSAVQAEIEERLKVYAEALARGDIDGALRLFAPDAIVGPPDVEPLQGTAALREFFERTFAALTIGEGRFFTEELYLYDSLAFHFGSYEFGPAAPLGARWSQKGGFAIVWRRQRDGTWRYHRGMMNSIRKEF